MSYARFSSDDFRSDVYCWHDGVSNHFVIAVANKRVVYKEPLPDPVVFKDTEDIGAIIARDKIVRAMLNRADRVPIGLPHDGAYLQYDTAAECADALERLQAEGYNVPQYAIDALREEAQDQSDEADSSQ